MEKTLDKTISVLVALPHKEDQKDVLASLSEHSEISIVGIEKDETGVIIKTEQLKPNVIVLDLQLSMTTEHKLAQMILRRSPSTAIIMLCLDKAHQEQEIEVHASLALKAGVSGFLIKDEDIDKLAYVINIVSLNGCYINKTINNIVYNEFLYKNQFPEQLHINKHMENASTVFTALEKCIITQMAKGFSDEEIAENLHYNEGTIKNCLTVIKRKTNLKNRIQIVVYAILTGLVQLDDLSFDMPDFPAI
ncbi:MAG: response regulator transcription factor [Treponema sp.]|nr:response regulator transcription factor [Treponema sp.]